MNLSKKLDKYVVVREGKAIYVRPADENKKSIVDSGVDKNFDRCESDLDVDECDVSTLSDIELRYFRC